MISNQEGSETVFACGRRAQQTGDWPQTSVLVVADAQGLLFLVMRTRSAVFHTQKPRERDETRANRGVD